MSDLKPGKLYKYEDEIGRDEARAIDAFLADFSSILTEEGRREYYEASLITQARLRTMLAEEKARHEKTVRELRIDCQNRLHILERNGSDKDALIDKRNKENSKLFGKLAGIEAEREYQEASSIVDTRLRKELEDEKIKTETVWRIAGKLWSFLSSRKQKASGAAMAGRDITALVNLLHVDLTGVDGKEPILEKRGEE